VISIVTIHKGDYKDLKVTVESVLSQSMPCVEYVVVASGLDSKQQAYVMSNAAKCFFDVDSSLYDAMNIGLQASTMSHILFLNSGDVLINADVLSFCGASINNDRTVYLAPSVVCLDGICYLAPTVERLMLGVSPGHQGFMAPISHDKFYFDDSGNFWDDGEWMKLYLQNYKSEVLPQPLVRFNFNGLSSIPDLRNVRPLFKVSFYLSIKYIIKWVLYTFLPFKLYFHIFMIINRHCLWKDV